jgi:hypothetical protein
MIEIIQVYTYEDCLSGSCDCASAAECKFRRREDCDNIIVDCRPPDSQSMDEAFADNFGLTIDDLDEDDDLNEPTEEPK